MIKMGKKLPVDKEFDSHTALLNYRNDNGPLPLEKHVVAVKNGKLIVSDKIPVVASDYGTYMSMHIMWEDAKYPNYKDLGLFGTYGNSYYHISYRDGELRIESTDGDIEIAIK